MPLRLSEVTKLQIEVQSPGEVRAAYMRQDVFANWLRRFHADIITRSPGRKVLLLLDNAPGHLIIKHPGFLEEIPNIKIITLPKNSTSLTQPLDAGIIAVFKHYYQDFLALSTMAHRVQHPNRSGHIDNKTAWKHIVQAWNLVKPESIRHCFNHVPLFNERQKAALTSTTNGCQDVDSAVRMIQYSVSQVNASRRPLEVTGSNDSEIEAAIDEDQTEVLSSTNSLALWTAIADEGDVAAIQNYPGSIPILPAPPVSDYTSTGGSISDGITTSANPQQSLSALSLHGLEGFENMPKDRQNELLSHADTLQIHFGRLSKDLNCQSIYQPGLDELKKNPLFSHFFETREVRPGSSPSAASMLGLDLEDDEELDDIDYHHPLLRDESTTTYTRKVGRGKNVRELHYTVTEAPSTGGSLSSVTSVIHVETTHDITPPFSPTREDRGEIMREAAEMLDPSIFTPENYKVIREGLELAYDCTITPKKNYHPGYIKEYKNRASRLNNSLSNFESFIVSRPISNPFI
jgi:hypothetical protein